MKFRKILFWVHLVAGLISGISVGIMCFTGTALAFEKELIAWSERDARRVEPPASGAPRLSLDELQAKLREAQPEARPASIVLQNDPRAAIAFSAGRGGGLYMNPYTAEVKQSEATGMSEFMHVMTDWHRTLGFHGEVSRGWGKWINGVCNIAFCGLAITGLYLWWPRSWSMRSFRAIALFNWRLTGKARDFNWHNSIGLWTAPVLVVLTLTAMPISFRWAGDFIYTLTGTPAPALAGGAGGPGGGGPGGGGGRGGVGPAIEVPIPSPEAKPLSQDALLAAVLKETPQWETITLRTGNAAAGGGRGAGGPGGRGGAGGRGGRGGARGEGGARGAAGGGAGLQGGPGGGGPGGAAVAPAAPTPGMAQAVTFAIRTGESWPRTASTTLALNPYTGELVRRTTFADQNAAQQVRSWTRFLHTGEALGKGGQFVAGLACLGGCFLVYTGLALSWRRFFGKKSKKVKAAVAAPAVSTTAA